VKFPVEGSEDPASHSRCGSPGGRGPKWNCEKEGEEYTVGNKLPRTCMQGDAREKKTAIHNQCYDIKEMSNASN